MLNLEALEVVFDPLGYEVSTVIRDDGMRDPVPAMMLFLMNFFVAATVTVLYEAASTHFVK